MTDNNGDARPFLESTAEISLDPSDWEEFRRLAHQGLEDALDYLQTVRDRPVWRPVPESVRARLQEPAPVEPSGIAAVYRDFREMIFPYATGNIHPRFFGWVHGTGLPSGILAEMLAAAMNANCGGRDHGPIYVERRVIEWCKELFAFPPAASGLLVSGTSMANLIGLAVARNAQAGFDVRREGLAPAGGMLTAYTSTETHHSVQKAIEMLGLGYRCLRKIAVDADFRISLPELRQAVAADRATGFKPFCVIGSAGTVDTGAFDDLEGLAKFCQEEKLWFHVDGAFGALCVLNDALRPKVAGIEQADSIAFDFHKWMYVQYDAGCILVRNSDLHRNAFSVRRAYLQGAERGLAGGGDWFCDFGMELSRGFRALKIWFALKEHGVKRLGRMLGQNCRQARYLAELVKQRRELELAAEPSLNIVCFRYRDSALTEGELDVLNREIVADLQERGIAAPSTTRVRGKTVIRAAITNHRSRREDFDILVEGVASLGRQRLSGQRRLSSPAIPAHSKESPG